MDEDDKLKGEDNSFLSASLLDDAYFMLEVFFIRRTKLNFYKNLIKRLSLVTTNSVQKCCTVLHGHIMYNA